MRALRDDDDEPGADVGQQAQVLQGELAEPSGADDEHARAGRQPWPSSPDRAVRGQPRIGQRRRLDRVQATELDEVARVGDEHHLGVAAIGLEAG